jgi:spore germination protein D
MKRFTASIGCTISCTLLITAMLSGCGGGNMGQQKETSTSGNYNETKQMVLDILKTSEGQEAIKGAMTGGGMSTQSQGQGKQGGQGQGQNMKSQAHIMMQDPKFASSMAKAMQDENKKLMKDLMKDPEYQKMMLNAMRDPDYQKMILEIMKSPAYRQQTMTVMREAVQSPIFRSEMVDLVHKAQEQMIKPETQTKGKGEEKGKKSDQGDQSGEGDQGEGEGEGAGGGGGGGGK